MARIYIASKMHVDPNPVNATRFWETDEKDIAACDVLICYAEDGEHLCGALVEVGIAIGYAKQIIIIDGHPDYGTWQYHPLVAKVSDLAAAFAWITSLG